jgi:7,8-dihydropterin-6-yl-methyl-4-(beta-D-ribofuranosyl)aminobenzene 5'-phosphate synthase
MSTLRLTVLVQNTVNRRQLRAEHGLAFHLQTERHTLLFDTGQSDLLCHNALRLCLPLDAVDSVALSHGHYDHTGGLLAVCKWAPGAAFYLHPAAWTTRFACPPDEPARSVGMSETSRQTLREAGAAVVETTGPTEIFEGIFVTGAIPRETEFEDVGGPFFLDRQGTRPDPLTDDQALFFDTNEGLVVVLGCAHAGVVNTLRHIRQLAPDRPIHTVLGGMHLLNASEERIEQTVVALRELDVQQLAPAHCTGAGPTARLWQEFPERCRPCAVGDQWTFSRA